MHVPRLALLTFSSWWSSPSVWPTSWQLTRFRQAVVLYFEVLKYVSFSLTVACVMCLPETHPWATPSQPVLPYAPLQTSSRPAVGRQVFDLAPRATTVVLRTVD